MSYFPDLCALTPEILREHSLLSFSGYLTLFRLSWPSPAAAAHSNKELYSSDLCVETYSVLCLSVSIIWLFPASWPMFRLVTEITSDYMTLRSPSREGLCANVGYTQNYSPERQDRVSWAPMRERAGRQSAKGQIEISTSWAPSRSQKGNSFIFLFTIEHLGALSNLTLSVRKSISYFDQNLILGTKYWPADIDVINIDQDGEYRRQSIQSLCWKADFLRNVHMFSHLLHCQCSNISLFHHWINIVG